MQAADVMVMPSVREGMPVTMIEAGAAGLPIVITEMPGIREATEIGCEATLLALDRPNEVWANAVIEALDSPRPSPAEALSRMTESPFSSEVSARTMEAIYHHDAG
jgi:glycosyltransferase involved in cell wall biosynthesis